MKKHYKTQTSPNLINYYRILNIFINKINQIQVLALVTTGAGASAADAAVLLSTAGFSSVDVASLSLLSLVVSGDVESTSIGLSDAEGGDLTTAAAVSGGASGLDSLDAAAASLTSLLGLLDPFSSALTASSFTSAFSGDFMEEAFGASSVDSAVLISAGGLFSLVPLLLFSSCFRRFLFLYDLKITPTEIKHSCDSFYKTPMKC